MRWDGSPNTGSEWMTWIALWADEQKRREQEPPPDHHHPSLVYFIRGGPAFKIGTTTDIRQRFETIYAQSPLRLELIGLVYGDENIERWCQAHCIEHRSHYEWFKWNGWTEAFVKWVLAHGDDAATRLCPDHVKPDGPYAARVEVPQLPHMKSHKNRKAQRSYRERADVRATSLGVCPCRLCAAKPWERWKA